MNPRFATWKSVTVAAVLAVLFYLLAYSWVSRRQTGRGPWQVNFTTNNAGVPHLILAQQGLGVSNVIVHFLGEKLALTNTTGQVSFAKPKLPTPFCELVYDDLMFQPGVVTLDCFGHVIEMSPRALGLNGAAVVWTNGAVYELAPTNKMPVEARQKLKGGYRR